MVALSVAVPLKRTSSSASTTSSSFRLLPSTMAARVRRRRRLHNKPTDTMMEKNALAIDKNSKTRKMPTPNGPDSEDECSTAASSSLASSSDASSSSPSPSNAKKKKTACRITVIATTTTSLNNLNLKERNAVLNKSEDSGYDSNPDEAGYSSNNNETRSPPQSPRRRRDSLRQNKNTNSHMSKDKEILWNTLPAMTSHVDNAEHCDNQETEVALYELDHINSLLEELEVGNSKANDCMNDKDNNNEDNDNDKDSYFEEQMAYLEQEGDAIDKDILHVSYHDQAIAEDDLQGNDNESESTNMGASPDCVAALSIFAEMSDHCFFSSVTTVASFDEPQDDLNVITSQSLMDREEDDDGEDGDDCDRLGLDNETNIVVQSIPPATSIDGQTDNGKNGCCENHANERSYHGTDPEHFFASVIRELEP